MVWLSPSATFTAKTEKVFPVLWTETVQPRLFKASTSPLQAGLSFTLRPDWLDAARCMASTINLSWWFSLSRFLSCLNKSDWRVSIISKSFEFEHRRIDTVLVMVSPDSHAAFLAHLTDPSGHDDYVFDHL